MKPRALADLANALDAQLVGDPDTLIGPDVVIDSRQATPGALFVALPGERVDGHDYVEAAAARGATAAIALRPTGLPTLVVDDVQLALGRLGRLVVDGADGLDVVAITGSAGKTSTKDLLAQVLATAGECVRPENSFNNEIGVPLTATRIVEGRTRFLVSEMGARGRGHIALLCRITPPQVSIALNVGHAHLGEFGGIEQVAQAKGEIVEALTADGWAVLNADDPRTRAMATRTAGRIALFGTGTGIGTPEVAAELVVRAEQVHPIGGGRFGYTLVVESGVVESGVVESGRGTPAARAEVLLTGAGEHQVSNSLAAATAAICLGLEVDAVAAALGAARVTSHWRMELSERSDGVLVVNDAYNANPESMRVALRTAADLRTEHRANHPGARLVAVLGDMLELGEETGPAHRALGVFAAELGVDRLVAVGAAATDLAAGFGRPGDVAIAFDAGEAQAVVGTLAAGDVVLVKASRGLDLQTVAEALLAGSEVDARAASEIGARTEEEDTLS